MRKFAFNRNIWRVYCSKLWLCLALIALASAIGCKQTNSGSGREKPTPTLLDEITITVKCDDGLVVKTPNTFKEKKNSTWKEIKEKAINKITPKDNNGIKEWRLKDAKGEILKDTDKFEKDETIFAVSIRKTASYKVEHWQENIENEEYTKIEKDTEERIGEIGKNTEAVAKQYEGFKTPTIEQKLVEADGSTVVQIKYKRNHVSLILDLQGGKTTTVLEDYDGNKKLNGKFGASVYVETPTKDNHNFEKWEPALPTTFPHISSTTVYAAKWTAETIKDEVTHSIDAISFKMKLIKEVTNAVLGDNSQMDNTERDVSLSSYYMGETEVTQELWQTVMGSNPSSFKASLKNPVEKVTWFDCVKFCNKLTEKLMNKEDCVYIINGSSVVADFSKKGFRLPTEAEWEYAAMGGEKHKYAGCNLDSELADYAWYANNSDNKTHEVGTKKANKYGLFDMSGNVSELCWDWYSTTLPGGKDPIGAALGQARVNRGGGWISPASYCERATRLSGFPTVSANFLGLRLACRP